MNATIPHTTSPSATRRLPEELVASSTFLLKRLGFTAKERSLAAYEQTGLHPYHHAILIVLDERPHETQGSIADALGYDRGQLVGLLDELEEKGLVAAAPRPERPPAAPRHPHPRGHEDAAPAPRARARGRGRLPLAAHG